MKRFRLFLLNLIFLFNTNCGPQSLRLDPYREDILFEKNTLNYHEIREIQRLPANVFELVSKENMLFLQISVLPLKPAQQSGYARLGAYPLQFSFDPDFVLKEEQIPCHLSGEFQLQQLTASMQGAGIAIGRIAFFVEDRTDNKIIAKTILEEVTVFENQSEVSPLESTAQKFSVPLFLTSQKVYAFYIEILGKVETFAEGASGKVEINCRLQNMRLSSDQI